MQTFGSHISPFLLPRLDPLRLQPRTYPLSTHLTHWIWLVHLKFLPMYEVINYCFRRYGKGFKEKCCKMCMYINSRTYLPFNVILLELRAMEGCRNFVWVYMTLERKSVALLSFPSFILHHMVISWADFSNFKNNSTINLVTEISD